MGFQTGLSGLNTSSKTLDVIGNNIANANTVGFKSSRNEFAELVSASLGSVSGAKGAGIGAAVATVAQQFSQGNVSVTGNSLDVAINGSGFYQVTRADGTTAFSRDGQLKVDTDGNIKTNTGGFLMGYPTDTLGVPTSVTLEKLSVPSGAPLPAKQTTSITAEFNLDARAKVAAVAPATFVGTYGTSLTAFDSQGVPVPVNLYFGRLDRDNPTPLGAAPTPPAVTTPRQDLWAIYDKITDPTNTAPPSTDPTPVGYLGFDATGKLANVYDATGVDTATAAAPGSGAVPGFGKLEISLTPTQPSIVPTFYPVVDLSNVSQFGIPFAVSDLKQDGYTAGDLTGVNIEPTGIITTRYSNGQTQSRGKIALADFRNLQGLAPVGGGEYLETFLSGQPILGSPGIGKFGELRAGAVEESNVDLTAELVNLLTAQRNYQANAQTIKAQDTVQQTLVNLR